MEYSICIPYMEAGYDRGTTLDWCREVDAGPFATLSCGERVISYSQDMRVILSAAAALTERVRIMPSLYVLPAHAPVRAAKEIATLNRAELMMKAGFAAAHASMKADGLIVDLFG